jgi:hypothetical protein
MLGRPIMLMVRTAFVCVTTGYVLFAAGCAQEEDITRHRAGESKPIETMASLHPDATNPDAAPSPATQVDCQMVAAIVLRGDKAWFFKATGPTALMKEKAQAFTKFVGSVRFGTEGTPIWTLPDGWVQRPGSSLRFATIEMGAAPTALELSVMELPKHEDDASYLLANVNRWREQLGLPPTTDAEVERLAALPLGNDGKAILVELVGQSASGAASPSSGSPTASTAAAGHFVAPSRAALRFDTPAGWTVQPPRGSRRAAFTVQDGDQSVDISVQSFPAAAPLIGDPLANVNRWRGELDLESTTAEELKSAARKLTVNGEPAVSIEITGAPGAKQKAIFATLFKSGEEMWFVKLIGSAPLAERERERLAGFLASLKLTPQEAPGGD